MLVTVVNRRDGGYAGSYTLPSGTVLTFASGQAGPVDISYADVVSLAESGGFSVTTSDNPPPAYDPALDAEMTAVQSAATSQFAQGQRAAFAARQNALPVTSTAAEVTNVSTDPPPMFMDADGHLLRAGSTTGVLLQRSTDEGATWTTLATMPRSISGIRQLDNGELLIGTSDDWPTDTIKSAIYVTTGYPGSGLTTRQVLTADDYQQSLDLTWGFGGANGIYVVSEYDSKAPGSRSATQKVWLTTDSFATTSVIYDNGNGSLSSRHVHGCAYDQYRDAIWVTLGDYTGDATGNRRIIVSWDHGATWHDVTTKNQPTAITVFPDCVLFGNDNAPNGFLRIANPSPTNLRVDVAHKVSNYIDPTTHQPALSHVAATPFRATTPGSPLLQPFSIGVAGQYGLVVATTDGYTFDEVWQSPTTYSSTADGPHRAIGPTPDGRILLTGQKSGTFWHTQVTVPDPGLTSAAAKVSRSVTQAAYRRAFIALANDSTPYQSIPGGGAVTELILSTANAGAVPTFIADQGDLFTPSPDGLGVTVNRDVLVHIEVDSGMGQQFSSPRVGIGVDGSMQVDTPGRTITRTMWVHAGQRISGFGFQSGASAVAVYGTGYGLVLEAWENF